MLGELAIVSNLAFRSAGDQLRGSKTLDDAARNETEGRESEAAFGE